MNTTKPSAGAVRAAKAILDRDVRQDGPGLDEALARIIDSESGLAELLEAARNAQCDCSPKERDSGHKSECWFPALREAIAKASDKKGTV